MRNRPSNHLSAAHLALLKATVLDGSHAADAWSAWLGLSSISRADGDESVLLPLIAERAATLGASGADETRLRGLRRHASIRNFIIRGEIDIAAQAMRDAAIDSVAIKGVALAVIVGVEHTRAMGDADLLVSPDRAVDAVAVLRRAGFELGLGLGVDHLPAWMHRFHAIPLARPGKPDVDVHWRLSHQPLSTADAVTRIMDAAVSTDSAWRVPPVAHQMAVTIAHGCAATSQAPLRAHADLAALLRAAGDVDAAAVDAVLQPHRLRAAAHDMLSVLADIGLARAATLRDQLPKPSRSDRVVARILAADRHDRPAMAVMAIAHRSPAPLRRGPVSPLVVAQPFRANAAASLAGDGWWLGDSYALWARRRTARLTMHVPATAAAVDITTVRPPGVDAQARVRQARRLRRIDVSDHGVARLTLPPRRRSGNRRVTIVVRSVQLVQPHQSLGNGDLRRIGCGVVDVALAPHSA